MMPHEAPDPRSHLDPQLDRALDALVPSTGSIERDALRIALMEQHSISLRNRQVTQLAKQHGYNTRQVSATKHHLANNQTILISRPDTEAE